MLNEGEYNTHAQELVRDKDFARYATVLFAPEQSRASLFAIFAFNQELAKIRETSSEPAIGNIKFQWWREALEGIRNAQVRGHPIVQALSEIEIFNEIHPLLDQMIEARQNELLDEEKFNFTSLVRFAEGVGGSLSQAAGYLVGVEDTGALKSSGNAWMMLGILRAVAVEQTDDNQTGHPVFTKMTDYIETELANSMDKDGGKCAPRLLNALTLSYLKVVRKKQDRAKALVDAEKSMLGTLWTITKAVFTGKY